MLSMYYSYSLFLAVYVFSVTHDALAMTALTIRGSKIIPHQINPPSLKRDAKTLLEELESEKQRKIKLHAQLITAEEKLTRTQALWLWTIANWHQNEKYWTTTTTHLMHDNHTKEQNIRWYQQELNKLKYLYDAQARIVIRQEDELTRIKKDLETTEKMVTQNQLNTNTPQTPFEPTAYSKLIEYNAQINLLKEMQKIQNGQFGICDSYTKEQKSNISKEFDKVKKILENRNQQNTRAKRINLPENFFSTLSGFSLCACLWVAFNRESNLEKKCSGLISILLSIAITRSWYNSYVKSGGVQ